MSSLLWAFCYPRYQSPSSDDVLASPSESDSGSTDKPSSIADPWGDSGTSTASGESAPTLPTESSSKTVTDPNTTNSSTTVQTEDLLKERGSRYGVFRGHAFITQTLSNFVLDELDRRDKTLSSDQREALHMIFHKIGRIVNGDPDYSDSWHDIAGYAKLVADRLDGVVR
jgi:hypothetical protein